MGSILVLDRGDLVPLTEALLAEGLEVALIAEEEEFLAFAQREEVSCAVINLEATKKRLDLVKELLNFRPVVPVIVLSQEAQLEEAVQAIKLGAADYRLLRTDVELLREIILKNTEEQNPLPKEGFLTANAELRKLLERLKTVAQSQATVLITGESGTGKEVLARYLHQISDRAQGPFIALNCAALPEHLLESELFGHEKGAFTGATHTKRGRFELAHQGSIFLDEIGELPLNLQPKLLRILQEGKLSRLGSEKDIEVDVRVISATNRDLKKMVDEGLFREDLYYRLNVFEIELPPLRERREDIPKLIQHFTERYAFRPVEFSPEALDYLIKYPYPGNIRELEHIVQRTVTLARGSVIRPEDLPPEIRQYRFSRTGTLEERLAALEKDMILEALRRANWVQTKAAELLGISERVLRYKMAKHGLKRPKS